MPRNYRIAFPPLRDSPGEGVAILLTSASFENAKGCGRARTMTSSDDFFQPPPPRSEPSEKVTLPEWWGPTRGSLPAVVSLELVVAATEDVVVYLAGADVYPKGFVLHFSGVGRGEQTELDPMTYGFAGEADGEIPPEKLRLGIQFADGSKATNTGGVDADYWEEDGPEPDHPLMRSQGGSSGDGVWDQRLWVWPLPPPGPMELVSEWPAQDIPLTRCEVDSQQIRDAAARAHSPFGS